eukprot:UN5114
MSEFIYRLNKPILAKHGFRETVAGLAELDQMVLEEIEDAALADAVARYYHLLCFGWRGDLEQMTQSQAGSVKYTAHIIWMGILTSTTPLIASYMSYMHHLALPPLERRLRSYARTIAVAEALLVHTLLANRQLRTSLEGRALMAPFLFGQGRRRGDRAAPRLR